MNICLQLSFIVAMIIASEFHNSISAWNAYHLYWLEFNDSGFFDSVIWPFEIEPLKRSIEKWMNEENIRYFGGRWASSNNNNHRSHNTNLCQQYPTSAWRAPSKISVATHFRKCYILFMPTYYWAGHHLHIHMHTFSVYTKHIIYLRISHFVAMYTLYV